MGVKVNAQTNHNHPYVLAVNRLNEACFAYGRMPWLWFKPIWRLSGYEAKYELNLKIVTDFTKNVIANRREEFESGEYDDEKKNFLDILLKMERENELTDQDIRDEVETVMFEGW